jgi:glycosyltransferase involved in cell wall biosynthesis
VEPPLPPIKVLALHNRYRNSGGEDQVFAQETALLRRMGHTVVEYQESNDRLQQIAPLPDLLRAIWSTETVGRLRTVLRETRPDVAHFHNTFAMISPSAYYACREANVPVVQTLHNYRLGCPNACCSFNGQPCEKCVSRTVAWPGIVRKCYRQSRAATAGVAAITATHKLLGTYRRMVDAYISTTAFARAIHIRSGLPERLVFVKPNFADPPAGGERQPGGYALYVGRITIEKGVDTLLAGWEKLRGNMPLLLAGGGDGPIAESVRRAAAGNPNIQWLGERPHAEIMGLMLGADFLIQPSPLYEGCGMAIIEAFSAGLPCVVAGHGSLGELVEDGGTGKHFPSGNAAGLAAKVEWMRENPGQVRKMGEAARARFLESFSPARNYKMLMDIYQAAREHRKQ